MSMQVVFDAFDAHNKVVDDVISLLHKTEVERDTLRRKLVEYEGENKRWHSFWTVQAIVKERDELQRKLDIAVEALVMLRCGEQPYGKQYWEFASEALAEIEEID